MASFPTSMLPSPDRERTKEEWEEWIRTNFHKGEELPSRTINTQAKGRAMKYERQKNMRKRAEVEGLPKFEKANFGEDTWYDKEDHKITIEEEERYGEILVQLGEPKMPMTMTATPRTRVHRTIVMLHGSYRGPRKGGSVDPTLLLERLVGSSDGSNGLHLIRLVCIGGSFEGSEEEKREFFQGHEYMEPRNYVRYAQEEEPNIDVMRKKSRTQSYEQKMLAKHEETAVQWDRLRKWSTKVNKVIESETKYLMTSGDNQEEAERKILVIGNSQGAHVALDWSARYGHGKQIGGVVAMIGSLLSETEIDVTEKLLGIPEAEGWKNTEKNKENAIHHREGPDEETRLQQGRNRRAEELRK